MMITVRKPTPEEVAEMEKQPTWSCEASEFKWVYNDKETCLVKKGRVTVTYDDGKAEFGEGDYVVFEKGLQCVFVCGACVFDKSIKRKVQLAKCNHDFRVVCGAYFGTC